METTTKEKTQVEPASAVKAEPVAIITREASLVGSDLFDPLILNEQAQKELELAGAYRESAIKIALRQTGLAQWVNFRGDGEGAKDSFYPTGAAADAIFNFFGLHLSTPGPADMLAQHTLYTDDAGRKWWIAESKLWRGGRFVCHCEGKRLIGGFAKNELDARQDSTENLKSRAARSILGIKGKSLEDMRALGLDLSKCRVAEFQDRKSGASENPDEAVINWGNAKGKKVSELEDKDLEYYVGRYEKDVADPSKAKFKPERMLKALKTEQERRASKPTDDAAFVDEMEKLIAQVREEAMAAGVPEAKLTAYIDGLKTIDQAKVALSTYRERRKKKEA